MRRLVRQGLEAGLASYLDRQQELLDGGADVEATWKRQRQSAAMRRIADILSAMTGVRCRCMYCEDSRGTDIEHFRPRHYRDQVFRWPNLLWICAGCNRCKGNRFPCDSAGQPLLIDPTAEDPWDFLFFDPQTGEITARWDVSTGEEVPKGSQTIQLLSILRHQAITEGRQRVRRNLERAVRRFLERATAEDGEGAHPGLLEDLLESIDDADGYGLAHWFFLREGQDEGAFRELRQGFPSAWAEVVARLTAV